MTSATEAPDPTLTGLTPKRSTRRNVIVITAMVLVLVAAWFSPTFLRPSVEVSGSGSWSPLPDSKQVFVALEYTASRWPRATVTAVSDVPGAHVAGTWVLDTEAAGAGPAVVPTGYTDGVDFLRAAYPRGAFDTLAGTVPPGHGTLLVLWDVTDCSLLVEEVPTTITVRSAFGLSTTRDLIDFGTPGWDVETLATMGVCPT